MNHYKSWSGLQKQLEDLLCAPLKSRITYFLTRYNSVHDAYGRAAIRLDGKELVSFSWDNAYKQQADARDKYMKTGTYSLQDPDLRSEWNQTATLSEYDFLNATTTYLQLPIEDALTSDDPLIRTLAILDRRVGARTLQKIAQSDTMDTLPPWVKQFYDLRLSLYCAPPSA